MELRYGDEGFDLRSWIIRLSAKIQHKKVVILKSGIKDCALVLQSSQVKGNFIEKYMATPAWAPILSVESTDHQDWSGLISKFRPMYAQLNWEERIEGIIQQEMAKLRQKLNNDPHFQVDAPAISKLVLAIFHQLAFGEEIRPQDEELFYQASIQWRKEIALKGKATAKIKNDFWARLDQLLVKAYPQQIPPPGRERVDFASIFAQPMIISPQINFADIFASVGVILTRQPEILEQAQNHPQRYQYLKGIVFESMRLFHPFPVLERELTKDLKIQDKLYPRGTQVFIMLDEFKQSPVVDPESWVEHRNPFGPLLFGVGPRSCPGRPLAEKLLTDLLQEFLALPPGRFHPEQNLLYSGRINDKKQGLHETLYQIKVLMKFLWNSFKLRSAENAEQAK